MATDERWIVVPRWGDFQHYRDRRPPWIKNYPRLLHDHAYTELSALERGFLHGIWLAYSESSEVLSETRARQLLVTSAAEARRWRDTLERLSYAGFITLSASRPLAARKQDARPETEKEKEGSKGREQRDRASTPATLRAGGSTPSSSSAATNRTSTKPCDTCHGDRAIPTTDNPDVMVRCPACT